MCSCVILGHFYSHDCYVFMCRPRSLLQPGLLCVHVLSYVTPTARTATCSCVVLGHFYSQDCYVFVCRPRSLLQPGLLRVPLSLLDAPGRGRGRVGEGRKSGGR